MQERGEQEKTKLLTFWLLPGTLQHRRPRGQNSCRREENRRKNEAPDLLPPAE
jgi:hypothetical protein